MSRDDVKLVIYMDYTVKLTDLNKFVHYNSYEPNYICFIYYVRVSHKCFEGVILFVYYRIFINQDFVRSYRYILLVIHPNFT